MVAKVTAQMGKGIRPLPQSYLDYFLFFTALRDRLRGTDLLTVCYHCLITDPLKHFTIQVTKLKLREIKGHVPILVHLVSGRTGLWFFP